MEGAGPEQQDPPGEGIQKTRMSHLRDRGVISRLWTYAESKVPEASGQRCRGQKNLGSGLGRDV